jgi:hypothetical protein
MGWGIGGGMGSAERGRDATHVAQGGALEAVVETRCRLHDQGEYVAAHTIQRTPRPAIDPWSGALEARLSQRAQCRLERPGDGLDIQRPPPLRSPQLSSSFGQVGQTAAATANANAPGASCAAA